MKDGKPENSWERYIARTWELHFEHDKALFDGHTCLRRYWRMTKLLESLVTDSGVTETPEVHAKDRAD